MRSEILKVNWKDQEIMQIWHERNFRKSYKTAIKNVEEDIFKETNWSMFKFFSYAETIQKSSQDPALKREVSNGNIAAQTFTFRELASATKNFRPECLVGEGGFGRVYKGRLETGQVINVNGNVLSIENFGTYESNSFCFSIRISLWRLSSSTGAVSRATGSSSSRFWCSLSSTIRTSSILSDIALMETRDS